MFSDNKKSKQQEHCSIQNVIAKGTKIFGTFSSEGDIRIDGIIEGDVRTPGKVVVGKTGEIHGSLQSGNAHFEGKFTGKLKLTGTLTLKASAHIEGEVVIEKLAIEPGATFNVSCVMKSTVKDIKGEQKGKKTA
ncbi:bactofilin family protein [Lacinutrix jangbogonensis]|uniref:bactofilin family protein n=1 Tax=Lacinutrix jangbogonensis TaxID=1469557 RepID=UPI00053D0731|nr:polymer-forming cytoskeletal protein [Lacinutrix jangbogonensis]